MILSRRNGNLYFFESEGLKSLFLISLLIKEVKISGGGSMISYEGLEESLKEKGIGKTELSTQLGLSTGTIAKRDSS